MESWCWKIRRWKPFNWSWVREELGTRCRESRLCLRIVNFQSLVRLRRLTLAFLGGIRKSQPRNSKVYFDTTELSGSKKMRAFFGGGPFQTLLWLRVKSGGTGADASDWIIIAFGETLRTCTLPHLQIKIMLDLQLTFKRAVAQTSASVPCGLATASSFTMPWAPRFWCDSWYAEIKLLHSSASHFDKSARCRAHDFS